MKNKNFLKKLAAVTLGFVMTLGVGAAGYAGAAGEAKATEKTYTCGFESSEGFTAGNSYQGTVTDGPQGKQWKTFYGITSTSSAITGSQSMAIRLYTSSNYGYTQMEFDLPGIKSVSAKMKTATSKSAKIKTSAYYSTDNGTTWTSVYTGYTPGTTAVEKSFTIPNSSPSNNYRIKFAIDSDSTKPSSSNAQFTIDDISITYEENGDVPESDRIEITGGNQELNMSYVAGQTPVSDSTIKYTCSSTDGALSSSLTSGSDVATLSLSGGTVTVTPKAVGEGTYVLKKGEATSSNTITVKVESPIVEITGVKTHPSTIAQNGTIDPADIILYAKRANDEVVEVTATSVTSNTSTVGASVQQTAYYSGIDDATKNFANFNIKVYKVSNEKVTFVAGTDKSSSSPLTKDGVSIAGSTFSRDDNYRFNSGTNVTVSCSDGLVNAVFTCTASGTNDYGPGKMSKKSGENGTYSYTGKIGTWTADGDCTSVTFSTSAQVRCTLIEVTKKSGTEKFSITYNGGTYGSGDDPTIEDKAEGAKFNLASDDSYTCSQEHYHFNGWLCDDDNVVYNAGVEYTMPAKDVTFTAQWAEDAKYSVTYLAGDGAEGTVPTQEDSYAGVSITLGLANNLRKTNYAFAGWKCSIDNEIYAENSSYTMPGSNVTFTAQWAEQVVITFESEIQGAQGIPQQRTIGKGSKIVAPENPTLANYSFKGWFVGQSTTPYDFDVGFQSDTTLVAKWALNHSVSYNLNGAEGTTPTQSPVGEGMSFTLADSSGFSKGDDWRFGGWSDGVNTYTAGAEYTMGDTDVEFTAVWNVKPNSITILPENVADLSGSYAECDWHYQSEKEDVSGKIHAMKTTKQESDCFQLKAGVSYLYNVDGIPGYISGIYLTNGDSNYRSLTLYLSTSSMASKDEPTDITPISPVQGTYNWENINTNEHYTFFYIDNPTTYAAYVLDITVEYIPVPKVPATGITLDNSDDIVSDTYGYGLRNIVANVEPFNAEDKTLTWASSNENVVTVDNGVLSLGGVTGNSVISVHTVNYDPNNPNPDLIKCVNVTVSNATYLKGTYTFSKPNTTVLMNESDDCPVLSPSISPSFSTSSTLYSYEHDGIQLGQNDDLTITLPGYGGKKIVGVEICASSNVDAGAGSFALKHGAEADPKFEFSGSFNSEWSTEFSTRNVLIYKDLEHVPTVPETIEDKSFVVDEDTNLTVYIKDTIKSLYIHSISLRYTEYAEEVSVSYNLNGGSGDVPSSTNYEVGETVSVTSIVPTKKGYQFMGWSDGNGHTYKGGDTFIMPSSDVTLTAVWEAISSESTNLVTSQSKVSFDYQIEGEDVSISNLKVRVSAELDASAMSSFGDYTRFDYGFFIANTSELNSCDIMGLLEIGDFDLSELKKALPSLKKATWEGNKFVSNNKNGNPEFGANLKYTDLALENINEEWTCVWYAYDTANAKYYTTAEITFSAKSLLTEMQKQYSADSKPYQVITYILNGGSKE